MPTGGPQPCSSATAEQANNGLTADEIATAYQFSGLYGAGDLGAGQTIAMFEQQPYSPTDIATYQACYGTSASVSNVDVAGGPGPYQPPPGSGDGESALDIEQAIGLAPKANILVYEGPAGSTVQIFSAIVSQDRAKVISSSYGVCEALTGGSTVNAESPLLQEAAVQGQSFFISSGDSGSNMCFQADQTNTSLSVIDPGGQPFATGVGGTSLIAISGGGEAFYTPGATPLETVWNDGFSNSRASGTGGGISSSFTMPSYQSGAPATLGVTNANSSAAPCGGASLCREVPDVAADADPNTGYVFADGNWGITGGTSAAAPLWAAFTALANASPTCRGLSLGFVNPSLYAIAGSSYLNNFSDVKTASPFSGEANNDAAGLSNNPNRLFPVTPNYDMTTGLGSMIAPALAGSLCSARAPVYSVTVANPGTQLSIRGHAVSLAVPGADSGAAALSYSASGLPAGLSLNPTTGVISGIPSTNQSTTVTVAATDAFTNAGSTAFTWAVVTPGKPTAVSPKVSGLTKGKPKLVFALRAGSFAPALQSVAISLPRGLGFAKKLKSLEKGITLKSGSTKVKSSVKASRGTLTIRFKSVVTSVSVTLVSPALTISSSTVHSIRKHKIKKLTVVIKTTDAAKQTNKFGITLTKLS